MLLQSAIKASTTKKKDKKKKNKAVQEDEDDEIAEGEAPVDKGPVQMTAEELADEEWGPVKEKKKKERDRNRYAWRASHPIPIPGGRGT